MQSIASERIKKPRFRGAIVAWVHDGRPSDPPITGEVSSDTLAGVFVGRCKREPDFCSARAPLAGPLVVAGGMALL